jgi:hypothetical protein
MVSPEEALKVVLEITLPLDQLEVPYLVGGSLASSLHGIPHTTQDADLVADLRPLHVQPFVNAVSLGFYVSPERIAQAVNRRSSFNLVHHRTGIKVDVFLLRAEPFALQEMARRQALAIPGSSGRSLQFASAEDTILQKLLWYQLGNRVSDRQWNDILGVLKVQRRNLDLAYLREWALDLEVVDLLRQAYEDAGIVDPA